MLSLVKNLSHKAKLYLLTYRTEIDISTQLESYIG